MGSLTIELKRYGLHVLKEYKPELFVKHKYKKIFGVPLDLKNPKGFNKKICWLALYWQKPLVVQCADKYELREYVAFLGLMELMPGLYGVYTDVKNIEWDKFLQKFVVKCAHGCKYNIVCFDKAKLNLKAAEEGLPNDYKVYCFNGEPKCVLVCLNRESGLTLEWYDLEGNILDVGWVQNLGRTKKPECLDRMIEYVRRLFKDIPFGRVDFYDCFGKPDIRRNDIYSNVWYGTILTKRSKSASGEYVGASGKISGSF